MPYDEWLRINGGGKPTFGERIADFWVHKSLMLFKLPLPYLNPLLPRRTRWQDEGAVLPANALQT